MNERVDFPSIAHTISNSLQVFAVGRLVAVKDHAFLIRASAALKKSNVEFECLIAGDGPERQALEGLIRRLGLEKKVRLLGHVPHERMNSFYDKADVVALTSRSEGIPLVLMEAMARGRIVVAPNITGIPELVLHGKTGSCTSPDLKTAFSNNFLVFIP